MSSTIDDTIGALRALIHQLNDRHPINPMLAPLVAVSAPSRTPDLEEIVPPIPKPPLSMQEGHGGMISGSIHNLGSGVDYEAGSDDGTKSIDQSRMDEEEEDEEETLIMQGGTGIPIGRVSSYRRYRIRRSLITFDAIRMGYQNHSCLHLRCPTLGVNA